MINIGILTSSRADFGIYEPLLRLLISEHGISAKLIVFGTHLDERYGNSIQHIQKSSIPIIAQYNTAPENDSPSAITISMSKTMRLMNEVWEANKFDLLLALGDRYEMFAAVASTVPYNIKIGHIHGGETTTGAIDNAMRHSITHMSTFHFTANEVYRQRVIQLLGHSTGVFNTGALSVDSLSSLDFMTKQELKELFDVRIDDQTLLITLHPETINFEKNSTYADELIKTLVDYPNTYQVITMPNADTSGLIIRDKMAKYADGKKNVKLIENFGARGYLSLMKYSSLILGNSSSGFIEASWFPKWVVNIGERQGGRYRTENIIDVPFDAIKIKLAIDKALRNPVPPVHSVYGDGKASERIIKHILDELSINN